MLSGQHSANDSSTSIEQPSTSVLDQREDSDMSAFHAMLLILAGESFTFHPIVHHAKNDPKNQHGNRLRRLAR